MNIYKYKTALPEFKHSQLQAQAMSKETGRRQKLLQIEAALKRLENDDYGYCQECGDEIAPARLAVDPTVLLCIRCAEASETR